MRRLFATRGATAALTGVVVLLVGGGGFALASHGSTISVCVHKRTHALYAGRCKRGDTKLTWNRAGPTGPGGATGATGPQGPQGNQGSPGPAGTARAYGLVSQSGALSMSSDVTSVTNPFSGTYCITLASGINTSTTKVSSVGMLVTPDWSGDTTTKGPGDLEDVTHVEWEGDALDCPAGTLEVRTYDVRPVAETDSGGDTYEETEVQDLNEAFFFAVP